MIQNYFIVAFRKLRQQRDYAGLNILGLGLSVACGILIFSLLRHHLSFDAYHKNADRTLRIVMDVHTDGLMHFPGTPNPMAKTLREECAFVEKTATRNAEDETLISLENPNGGRDKYQEKYFAWVEPDYLDILDLPLLRGDGLALREPNTVLITENIAQKYFGKSDAIGKSLRINNEHELRIVGILRNLPPNTDYKQEILGSLATLGTTPNGAEGLNSWAGARGDNYCFALLKAGHRIEEMNAFLAEMTKRHPHPESKSLFEYKALAFSAMHFDMDYGFAANRKLMGALGLIGIFLLITACVNFINMATAMALTRMREVGVRKSLGSTRGQLFWQFMLETGLIVAFSLLVGLALARLGMPYMNVWMKENMQFDASLLRALAVFIPVLGLILTFLAGFYPGWIQARFNPVSSLKASADRQTLGGFSLRQVLVTTQFGISQMLIIGAAVVTAQMQYAQNADWGFRRGAVLTLDVPVNSQKNKLQQELSQIAGIKNVSLCSQPPASQSNSHTGIIFENRPESETWLVNNKPADSHYLETFGLQLVAGRNLQPADTVREFVVNEALVKKLNFASAEDILNKNILIDGKKAPVVGVIRDFHNMELSQKISPIIVSSFSDAYSTCAIQLVPGNPEAVLTQVQKIWESNFPDHYYKHQFMDAQLGEFMETETITLRFVRIFAGIAVFIGCLGLYGLAAFLVARKRKEVGVRKTLGASVAEIIWMFGKEYIRLIVIAFIVAAPIAWWAMDAWLKDYAYRISIGVGIFAGSLFATFAVAALTVGAQSIRAALANPVESLRSE